MSVSLRFRWVWRFVHVTVRVIDDGKQVDWWRLKNCVPIGFGWYFCYRW